MPAPIPTTRSRIITKKDLFHWTQNRAARKRLLLAIATCPRTSRRLRLRAKALLRTTYKAA